MTKPTTTPPMSIRASRRYAPALALLLGIAACQASPSPSQSSPSAATTESAAPTQGAAGLSVVTIGDSIPYAQYDCNDCASFTTLYADALEEDLSMSVDRLNLSTHDGLVGAVLLERVQTNESYRTALAEADVVVISIGGNDTPWNSLTDPCDGDNGDIQNWTLYTGDCVTELAARHGDELDAILAEIDTLRAGNPTAIRVIVGYNDWIGWDQAPPEAIEPSIEVLDAFSVETCQAAEAHDALCVDVYHSFNGADGRGAAGDLLAGDYTHPSALGHERIAELLLAAGLSPLAL